MGRSALDYACLERKTAIVEILIENYADQERLNEVFLKIMMLLVVMIKILMKMMMLMMVVMIIVLIIIVMVMMMMME